MIPIKDKYKTGFIHSTLSTTVEMHQRDANEMHGEEATQ